MNEDIDDISEKLLSKDKESPQEPYGSMCKTLNGSLKEKPCSKITEGSILEEGFAYTTTEIITALGFGKAQVVLLSVLLLGFFSQMCEIYLMPILSTRLYVEWDLTPSAEAALGSASYAGVALSFIGWGFIADKIGRRNALLLSNLWTLFWGMLCCVAPNLTCLIVFRVLFSFGGGLLHIMNSYYYEFLPASYRYIGFASGNGFSHAFGGAFPIVLAYFILTSQNDSWRIFVFWCTVPLVFFVILGFFFLLESPRYLVSAGKNQEAIDVFRKIAKYNNKELPTKLVIIPDTEQGESVKNSSLFESIGMALKDKEILGTLICVTLIGIGTRYVIYGLVFLTTELLFMEGESSTYCNEVSSRTYQLEKEDYLAMLIVQGIDFVSGFFYFIVLKFEISLKIGGTVGFGAAIVLLSGLYACPNIYVALFLGSAVRLVVHQVSILTWFSLSGLLPTKVRSSLGGLSVFIMYSILPASPYIIQVLFKYSTHLVTSISIFILVISFIASIILPRKMYSN